MAEIANEIKKRHDNIELVVSFVRSFVTDIIDKGHLKLTYSLNEEDTEVFVGPEYPVNTQNVKLIFLIREMGPSFGSPVIAQMYNKKKTLSALDTTFMNMELNTYLILVYARTRHDSKYYTAYLSTYLKVYEDDIRAKMNIQDFVRRNTSQTTTSYVTSIGNLYVTMISMTISKLDIWTKGPELTSDKIHTVSNRNIYSIEEVSGDKDGYIDVKK